MSIDIKILPYDINTYGEFLFKLLFNLRLIFQDSLENKEGKVQLDLLVVQDTLVYKVPQAQQAKLGPQGQWVQLEDQVPLVQRERLV